jgi:hypothetical protein
MSDTSGRISWGTRKAGVHRNFYNAYPRSDGRTKSERVTKQEGADSSSQQPSAGKIVWQPLQEYRQSTEEAFRAVTPYLKRMAEFIEIAASGGIPAVTAKFGVEPEARLASLQRKIRAEMSSGATSEFDPPAGRAFQVGSTKCVALLLKKHDPTKFVMDKTVESIQKDPDFALIQSAQCTLEDFGERIVISILPGGEGAVHGVKEVIRDFRAQLKGFMNQNSNAANWGSRSLESTIAKLARSLVS